MLEIHNKFFMNTSLYLPDELAKRLEKYVKTLQSGSSRNKVIAEELNMIEVGKEWYKKEVEISDLDLIWEEKIEIRKSN